MAATPRGPEARGQPGPPAGQRARISAPPPRRPAAPSCALPRNAAPGRPSPPEPPPGTLRLPLAAKLPNSPCPGRGPSGRGPRCALDCWQPRRARMRWPGLRTPPPRPSALTAAAPARPLLQIFMHLKYYSKPQYQASSPRPRPSGQALPPAASLTHARAAAALHHSAAIYDTRVLVLIILSVSTGPATRSVVRNNPRLARTPACRPRARRQLPNCGRIPRRLTLGRTPHGRGDAWHSGFAMPPRSYESWIIYNFLALMFAYTGGEGHIVTWMEGQTVHVCGPL